MSGATHEFVAFRDDMTASPLVLIAERDRSDRIRTALLNCCPRVAQGLMFRRVLADAVTAAEVHQFVEGHGPFNLT